MKWLEAKKLLIAAIDSETIPTSTMNKILTGFKIKPQSRAEMYSDKDLRRIAAVICEEEGECWEKA